jgi:ferredoxin
MKCIVIYLSQTGNTEKIAKAIQTGIMQIAGSCDIAKIKDVKPNALYEYDLIGLGSAVFGGLLGGMAGFLNGLRFVGGKHAFLFCTHGSIEHGGNFFPSAYRRAEKSGLVFIGTADWYGDCYLLHMPQPYPTAGHPDAIDLKEAEDFGREMVERSWRISAGETDLIPPVPPAPLMPDMSSLPERGDVIATGKYASMLKFHEDKCLYPNCRLCMDNCPMEGIDLSVKPPVIAKPCLDCEFCARLCPTGALDIAEWVEAMASMTSNVFEGPSGGMLYMFKKAEADGSFRRLAQGDNPDEYYSNLDNYGFKRHKKHPQWIIGKGAQ